MVYRGLFRHPLAVWSEARYQQESRAASVFLSERKFQQSPKFVEVRMSSISPWKETSKYPWSPARFALAK